jgi:DNA-binding MarR family transcriptional regulator
MTSSHTDPIGLTYSDSAPILIAATSDVSLARAVRAADASGCRVGAVLEWERARERIERQIKASIIWLEIDRDRGEEMDDLLSCVARNASAGRYAAVVSTTGDLLDPVAASLDEAPLELIVDADESERVAAFAIASARAGLPYGVLDIASDQSAARLRQLSDEVSRIAATLARLSAEPIVQARPIEPVRGTELLDVSAEAVRTIIRARRLRGRYFSQEIFADPAWDMLLDLLQAEISQLRVPVSSLCIAAAVPATTALRWLKTMVSQGLFLRRADPHDGRRVFVELAPETSRALRRYFAEVGKPAVI